MAGPFLPLPPHVVVVLVAVEGPAASHSLARSAALHQQAPAAGDRERPPSGQEEHASDRRLSILLYIPADERGGRSHAVAAKRVRPCRRMMACEQNQLLAFCFELWQVHKV